MGRRIAIENISYYYLSLVQDLSEAEFLTGVLEAADCDLLLDVNNVYVNSVNHGYSAEEFLAKIPAKRIAYLHIGGHHRESAERLVDTHGAPIVSPVWWLLELCYEKLGVVPTLLERDFSIPPLAELLTEVQAIRALQAEHESKGALRHG